MLDCIYYQAHVKEKETWFLVATLRSFEHLAFDRTLNKSQSIFEFFVSPGQEEIFLMLMNYYKSHNIIYDFKKLPNRLAEPQSTL